MSDKNPKLMSVSVEERWGVDARGDFVPQWEVVCTYEGNRTATIRAPGRTREMAEFIAKYLRRTKGVHFSYPDEE